MSDQFAGAPQAFVATARQLPPAIRDLHRVVSRGFLDDGHAQRDDLRAPEQQTGAPGKHTNRAFCCSCITDNMHDATSHDARVIC